MNEPFFTVVIPTHNRSNLLKRAIESVLNQTFEGFELIIVDDHSTDDTSSVVSLFSDSRIQYAINYRTKGACGARNVGIFSAKGKWVAFLDDDDVWLPDKLKCQYELARDAKQTIGLICTDYAIYKEKQRRPRIVENRPSGWIRDDLLFGFRLGCLSSVCIRTDFLETVNGFDERFPSVQDWDLWLRITEVCEATYVPKILVHMHQDNLHERIGMNTEAKLKGHVLLRKKYSALIDQSLRLRHRHESYIFTFALLQNDKTLVAKCLPWVLLGSLIDLYNFLWTVRNIVFLTYRKKTQTFNSLRNTDRSGTL